MVRHKRSPAPAGRPGTGRVENELARRSLDIFNISNSAAGEALTAVWLARLGVRPALVATVAELASIGGAP